MDTMKAVLVLAIVGILLAGCAQQPQGNQPAEKTAGPSAPQTQKQAETPGQSGQVQAPTVPAGDEQPPAPPADGTAAMPAPPESQSPPASSDSMPAEFLGLWRDYSSRIFYDKGGGGALGTGSGVPLEINGDGTWKFGGSEGKWQVEAIEDSDWAKWGVKSYGPARKMVLEGWNKDVANGPVEESNGRVDFIWVIYRVGPPTVGSPGQAQVKYGHAS